MPVLQPTPPFKKKKKRTLQFLPLWLLFLMLREGRRKKKKIKDVISIFRPRGPIGERGPNKLDANPRARPLVALTVC